MLAAAPRNLARAQEKELYRVTRAGSVDMDKTHIATRRAEKEVLKKKRMKKTAEDKKDVIRKMKSEKLRIRAEREKQKELQIQKNRERPVPLPEMLFSSSERRWLAS